MYFDDFEVMWIDILLPVESRLKGEKKKEFISVSRLVVDSYNRHLAKLKVKFSGVKKIAITLYDFGEFDFFGLPVKGIPVICIDKTYNFEYFFSLKEAAQKAEILNLIQSCVKEAANRLEQGDEKIDQIKSIIEKEEFVNEYFEGKLKFSRDKQYKAGVFIKMHEDHADASVVFTDKDENEIARRHLIKIRPNRIFIRPLVGKSKWKTSEVFEVSDETGQIHFEANINNEDVRIYFTPKGQTEDELIDNILIASSQTDKEQVISLLNERINKLK